MPSLKETSLKHTAKKELTDLPEVSVDIAIQEGTFESQGKTVKFNYVEIDGYKYTVRSKDLTALKNVLSARPQTTKVKFSKTDDGTTMVLPID